MSVERDLQKTYVLYQKGNLEAARSHVLELLDKVPNHAKALHLAGMIFKAQQDIIMAHSYLTRALQLTPDDPEILNTMGIVLANAHEPVRAEKAYLASLAITPTYKAALKNLAFHRLSQQDAKGALETFDKLIALEPNNETYRLGRANALRDCERGKEALAAIEVLSDKKTQTERSWLRSQVLFDLGRYDDAIDFNQALLNSDGYSAGAIETTAQILHMQDKWAEADRYLTSILGDDKTNPEILATIAKIYMRASEVPKALAVIDHGLKQYEGHPDMLSIRGQIRLDEGNYREAFEDSFAALSARPGDLGLMAEFGLSALAGGRAEDAAVAADEALKIRPHDQFWIAMRASSARLRGLDYRYYFNYDKFVRVYDLKPPQGYDSMTAFNCDLKQALTNIHNFKKAPLDQSVRGGIQTSPNLRYVKHQVLDAFFEVLDDPIRDYMSVIGQNQEHILSRRNTGQYRILSAWSVMLSAGGHHVNHVHPEGWISSSYYVDVPAGLENDPDKAGWIKFGEPPFEAPRLPPELFIAPKPGRLVLFPSYLWHGTVPIKDGASRTTLPFDVVPA